MIIYVNGKKKDTTAKTVDTLISELNISSKYIAVTINKSIINRTNWESTEIAEKDDIEFFSPVGGG